MPSIDKRFGPLVAFLTLAGCLVCIRLHGEPGFCDICGKPLSGAVYTVTDQVTGEKKEICHDCSVLPSTCFICGLPVLTNATDLPDGRVLCERDARSAVLDDEAARRICRETKDNIDRLFSRFLSFPDTNVSIAVIDRVHLQDLFKFAGHDYVCPNVWGYEETRTNHGQFEHSISLLSGLPLAAFKATCAHEYTHTWLDENLGSHRRKTLSRDANEGFCELISFLLMDSQDEDSQKKQILRNAYTRGQIQVFIATDKSYGLSDIVDWMKFGSNDRLTEQDLSRVRVVEPDHPKARTTAYPDIAAVPPPPPDKLVFQGVIWVRNAPQALINGQSFAVNDEDTVPLGTTNVTIRCLAIQKDSVRVKIVGTGEERELRFKNDPAR